MQKLLFSPAACAFFDTFIHGENIPGDCVEITREKHVELMAAQAAGKVISADETGAPVAVDAPPPNADDFKVQARIALEQSDLVGLRCFKAGVKFPKEWRDYEVSLRAVVRGERADLPQVPVKPENI